jgi:hypothetical protein
LSPFLVSSSFHWFVQGLMHFHSFSRCHGVVVVFQWFLVLWVWSYVPLFSRPCVGLIPASL